MTVDISPEELQNFKEIYQRATKVPLDDTTALAKARDLLALYKLVYRPPDPLVELDVQDIRDTV